MNHLFLLLLTWLHCTMVFTSPTCLGCDIAALIEMDRTVSSDEYAQLVAFVGDFVQKLNDTFEHGGRFALMSYNDDGQVVGGFTNKASVASTYAAKLPKPKGSNVLSNGLIEALDLFRNSSIPCQYLLLMISQRYSSHEALRAAASQLKDGGTVIAVAVLGSSVDLSQIRLIASSPTELTVMLSDYASIKDVGSEFLQRCPFHEPVTVPPQPPSAPLPIFSCDYVSSFGDVKSGNFSKLEMPTSVCWCKHTIYVTEDSNSRVVLFAENGTYLGQFGSIGKGDGQFGPGGINIGSHCSPSGELFVADRGNNRIQVFDASGAYLRKWGEEGKLGGQFNVPVGLALNAAGDVYVTDVNQRVQRFSGSGQFILQWGTQGRAHGEFFFPNAVGVDIANNVYVADSGNNRIQVFTESGKFLRALGEELPRPFRLQNPIGLDVTTGGFVLIADSTNDRVVTYTTDGRIVDTFGKDGTAPGELYYPMGVSYVMDPNYPTEGVLYLADRDNSRIEKFNCWLR